jgi:hypothetical protein
VPHRSLLILALVSIGLLPIIAFELLLLGRGDDGAAAVAVFVLAYIAGCFLFWRRLSLKACSS